MKYKNSVNTHLGEEIRRLRESRNYTQEEFAFRCSISRAYYGRIERGEYNVTIKQCEKIACALDIRVMDLFVNLPDDY